MTKKAPKVISYQLGRLIQKIQDVQASEYCTPIHPGVPHMVPSWKKTDTAVQICIFTNARAGKWPKQNEQLGRRRELEESSLELVLAAPVIALRRPCVTRYHQNATIHTMQCLYLYDVAIFSYILSPHLTTVLLFLYTIVFHWHLHFDTCLD